MSDVKDTPAPPELGVMGSLPKTRPQRASARRGTARSRAAAKAQTAVPDTAAKPEPAKPASRAKAKPASDTKAKPASRAKAKPRRATPAKTAKRPKATEPERAPRQGFEAESELELRKPVQPPGSTELAASVVELIGELAQSGLTGGGKLLKDALSRLSR